MFRGVVPWLLVLALGCGGGQGAADGATPPAPDAPKPTEPAPPSTEPATPAPAPSEDAEPETGAEDGAAWPPTKVVLTDIACTKDEDCVPASCCHPSTCVAADAAPECGGTMCTADCRAGTMDCGGGCQCQDGRCAARLAVSFEPGPS